MEMGFPINDAKRAYHRAIAIDYAMLVAGAASHQAASRTATIAARIRTPARSHGDPIGALATLILGDRDWAVASAALTGSFHPQIAGKTGSTIMKLPFTFAF